MDSLDPRLHPLIGAPGGTPRNPMQPLPKAGEQATVAGIAFPLIVLSYNENTNTATLAGNHPETGMEVHLPAVCVSLLKEVSPPSPSEHATAVAIPAIGALFQLQSGGPAMTVVHNAADDDGILTTCYHFRRNGRLMILEVDSSCLKPAA